MLINEINVNVQKRTCTRQDGTRYPMYIAVTNNIKNICDIISKQDIEYGHVKRWKYFNCDGEIMLHTCIRNNNCYLSEMILRYNNKVF